MATNMIAWLTFIAVPILIGAGMAYIQRLKWGPRATAWAIVAGNALMVIFLLVALYGFGDFYGRVVFYEFLTGCGVSLAIQKLVNGRKRFKS